MENIRLIGKWFYSLTMSNESRAIYMHETSLKYELGNTFTKINFVKVEDREPAADMRFISDDLIPTITMVSEVMLVHPSDKIIEYSVSKTNDPFILSFQSKSPSDLRFQVESESHNHCPGHFSCSSMDPEVAKNRPYEEKIFRIQLFGNGSTIPEDFISEMYIAKT
jgi:hypothetical protein